MSGICGRAWRSAPRKRGGLVLIGLLMAGGLVSRAAGADSAIQPAELRCEYRVDPLGIDAREPRLSWILVASAGARGVVQKAYQILVASSAEGLAADRGDLWDTGRVESDQTVLVPYAGKPLVSHQACFWKVRTWTGANELGPWSPPARWSMGLLEPGESQAQWIGRDETEPTPVPLPANWIWLPGGKPKASAPLGKAYFRHRLEIPAGATIARATAWMTADNEFQLYVGSRKVGEGRNFHQLSEVNLAPHLQPGVNLVTVVASNIGPTPNPAGLLGRVLIEFRQGPPIDLRTDATWRCADNEVAGWQDAAFDDSGWAMAQDLGENGVKPWGPVAPAAERVLPARLLRREFTVDKPLRRATAYVCGLGLFELQVNGEKAGDHVLEPALTEYDKRAAYVTFDVTKQLKSGPNALGVMLGNGRYYAPRAAVPAPTRSFGYPKLLLHLRLEYADGTVGQIVSDPTWKLSTAGPILANNEYDGETYDARREMNGWSRPGFNDSAWQKPAVVEGPAGRLVAQMAEPLRVTEVLKPKSIKEIQPGVFVVDMGQNMVGRCRLKVRGPAGTQVRLRHAETLLPDGNLYTANLRGAKATASYTCNGQGEEIYRPRFTYFGFRYVEISGFPGKPDLDTLSGEVVHDDVRAAGEFRCSNPLLTRIHQNIRWGVRGNYRSMPTDCPQRDERQGWLGDRSAECKGESYLFDIAALYSKWLNDIEDTQKESGSLPDVAPSYWPIYSDNVTWPATFVIAPDMLYQQYGDTAPIARHYAAMKKWVAHMSGFMKDGIQPKDRYGDWCVPPESAELIHSKDPARKTSAEVMGSTYFYYVQMLLGRYAELLGKPEEAQQFRRQAAELNQAFNARFYKAQEGIYDNGTQTSCVLPLAFGMVPKDEQGRVFASLTQSILQKTNGHLGTGLVGGQWLMRTLSDNGQAELVYRLANNQDYPSWGYMIGHDATTIWELWNGNTADPAMNSGNHVMLVGDLAIWMYEYLAGIRGEPESPGFRRVVLRPYPVGDLIEVQASYRSVRGLIESHWRLADGKFRWKVTIPPNVQAMVMLPVTADPAAVTEGGRPAAEAPGVENVGTWRAATTQSQGVGMVIGSGTYEFVAPISAR